VHSKKLNLITDESTGEHRRFEMRPDFVLPMVGLTDEVEKSLI